MGEKQAMKKLSIVTATRAEYGILRPLICKSLQNDLWQTQLVVTGTHLDEAFGNTYLEIEQDGIPIYKKIPITESGDDAYAVSRMMANALCGFAAYFKEERPDFVVLLGDRTELLGIASAAMNERIPIVHLHGGELTQGAVDECVRHALTKMSYLHFTAAEEYRKRVIQMGEAPERVYFTGALGVENILSEKLLTREELQESVGFSTAQPYAVVTFHPVTLEQETGEQQMQELLAAMRQRKDLFFLITKANSDAGGRRLNDILERETINSENMKLVASLGMKRYLSAVKYAKFVLGNSSSGIIEAPALHVPTVNIGDRQQGRIMAESIICCEPTCSDIMTAMEQALVMSKRIETEGYPYENLYGDGHTSEKMIEILEKYMRSDTIDLKKKFWQV